MTSGGRPLLPICYKYNAQKVIYLIATADTGSTNTSIAYLSKYLDPFFYAAIFPLDLPLFMYKFFGYVNEVDSHKNQGSLIQCWKSYGLLILVGYFYVQQLLWELLLLISGNYFFVVLIEITIKNRLVSEISCTNLLLISSSPIFQLVL